MVETSEHNSMTWNKQAHHQQYHLLLSGALSVKGQTEQRLISPTGSGTKELRRHHLLPLPVLPAHSPQLRRILTMFTSLAMETATELPKRCKQPELGKPTSCSSSSPTLHLLAWQGAACTPADAEATLRREYSIRCSLKNLDSGVLRSCLCVFVSL